MDLPQLAHTVRRVTFPSARRELPLAAISLAFGGKRGRAHSVSHRPGKASSVKRDEPRGVVLSHGTVSFSESAAEHTWVGRSAYATRAAGLKTNSAPKLPVRAVSRKPTQNYAVLDRGSSSARIVKGSALAASPTSGLTAVARSDSRRAVGGLLPSTRRLQSTTEPISSARAMRGSSIRLVRSFQLVQATRTTTGGLNTIRHEPRTLRG
jgi:hypothetical protein